MKRPFIFSLTGLLSGVLITAAIAQPPPAPGGGPAVRPPISPYLNMLRQGSSPAGNYFGLVRPQQQFANSVQGLQQTTAQLGATQAAMDQPIVTGTGFGFQTQRNYFQNQFSFGGFNTTTANRGATSQGRPPGGGQFGQSPPHSRGGR